MLGARRFPGLFIGLDEPVVLVRDGVSDAAVELVLVALELIFDAVKFLAAPPVTAAAGIPPRSYWTCSGSSAARVIHLSVRSRLAWKIM
jgi:hypothetical protein